MKRYFKDEMLDPFTRIKLEKESESIQHLIWILEMKRLTLQGMTRRLFNLKRDNQVREIMSEGVSYNEICNKAEMYRAFGELVTD